MLAWPEQLLDRPQIGATLEQVGRERVPQRVRMGLRQGRRLGAAARAQVRSRRRTSEVLSRRPDLERNSGAARRRVELISAGPAAWPR